MDDFCLKFTDQAAADVALAAAGITVDAAPGWALDRIGTIWADPLTEGAPSIPETGYHANLRIRSGGLPAGLVAFQVYPSSPVRRFA